MSSSKLIADCGATKTEWCLLTNKKKKKMITKGISPYFLSPGEITRLLQSDLLPKIKEPVEEVFFYGTGLFDPANARLMKGVLKKIFPGSKVYADHDVMGAARALCGHEKGIACNLGTGIFSCYYNGKKIVKSRPGLGYALGDEGGGAYLGKKVIQHFLYGIFDEDLAFRFTDKYNPIDRATILENVYKKPFPNRYLASFALFLAENRGHYMIENIIEDGLNDFFFYHLCKYSEIWNYPVNFVGSVAFGFKDVLQQLCKSYEFELGKVIRTPMEGLVAYHS
ncbi:MAG: N-acetylglucosamine kinase [Chitinophagaceae bacterium]